VERGRPLYFAAVNDGFDWWLLIVGLVVGGGLVWFVLFDARRREVDVDDRERPREAAWLSAVLAEEGHDVRPPVVARLLELHRRYLEAPPPDDPVRPAASPSELPEDDGVGLERPVVEVHERHPERDVAR
jgi:hypothetical protein